MSSNRSMVISLIGRPNVGKSSLFNCFMKMGKKAITYDMPGVTRDRHYGIVTLNELVDEEKVESILVDTGGLYSEKISEDVPTVKQQNFNKFFNLMIDHAKQAISESDLVLFVVDIKEGLLPFDKIIVDFIRSQKKKVWLLINKYDSDKQMGMEVDFYSLGIDYEDMFVLSAAHRLGVPQLSARLHQEALDFGRQEDSSPGLQKGVTPRENVVGKLAIIGLPNVGKSTLLNNLLGAERALVSDIPGTTVDPIGGFFDIFFGKDIEELEKNEKNRRKIGNKTFLEEYKSFRKNNLDVYNQIKKSFECNYVDTEEVNEELDSLYEKLFEEKNETSESLNFVDQENKQTGSLWRSLHIVDTAGIRKNKSVEDEIEMQSVFRSLRCITEADIVVYMVDAFKGFSHQDKRLIDVSLEKGKSVVICLNKMDLLKDKLKDEKSRREWLEDLRYDLPWLKFCDFIPISAKFNKSIKNLKNCIKKTVLIRSRTVPTGVLNRHLFDLFERNPIMLKKTRGKRFKMKYASMIKSNPPTFLLFTNGSKGIPDGYRRYLQNGIRQKFNFDNSAIHLIFRSAKDLEERAKSKASN